MATPMTIAAPRSARTGVTFATASHRASVSCRRLGSAAPEGREAIAMERDLSRALGVAGPAGISPHDAPSARHLGIPDQPGEVPDHPVRAPAVHDLVDHEPEGPDHGVDAD